MPAEESRESTRKWLHLAPGLLAFAVRDLGYLGSIALTLALTLFNLWVLPRIGGRSLWRSGEWARGVSEGMILYPLSLLVVALATPGRPEILAGSWAMLAFGDAAATLAGRRFGRHPLPWNGAKSWVGLLSFTFVSTPALYLVVGWTAPEHYGGVPLLVAAGMAALTGAVLESLPWTMDDNLAVTVLGGAALFGWLTLFEAAALPEIGVTGAAAVLVAAAVARWSGALDGLGAVAGVVVGLAVWSRRLRRLGVGGLCRHCRR